MGAMNGWQYWHECIACGATFAPERFVYTCRECGGLLLVARDEEAVERRIGRGEQARSYFDHLRYGAARREYPNDSGVWLWRDLLLPGFPEQHIVSLKEGQTDLFEVPGWLGRELGLENLFIKMEGQAPSESFKDRGMPVAISDALRLQADYPDLGIKGIMCASTGDTSAAAAVYAAYVRDRLSSLVLVPDEKIADAQLFQAMAHGAVVRAVRHPDGFDACMKLIQEFTKNHPEMVLVNSRNDMRIVGQESIALEIVQDLEWHVPDVIAIPVGNGGNLSALLSSLLRARRLGLIERLPKVVAAQTAAADTLVRWHESGYQHYEPRRFRDTVASAMNINDPVSYPRVRKLYREFDIWFTRSQEEEIKDTWAQLMRAGANVCPQGAVAVHGLEQARKRGIMKPAATAVAVATASGLKFSEAGIAYHKGGGRLANPYVVVEGGLASLEQSLI